MNFASISLNNIVAFDAVYEKSIEFNYSGGGQAVKNRLIIYDDFTNGIVYSQETVTYRLSHIIPANTLTNGKNYNCQVIVYDIEGNEVQSSKRSFICLTTPVWTFKNIVPKQVIDNSSYTIEIDYRQMQGELLNEYKLVLYSSGKSSIWDSGVRYDTDLSCQINGFSNNTNYYLQASGKTVNGIFLDTGLIEVSVRYESMPVYTLLDLENKKMEGIVQVSTNIISILGKSIPQDIYYIDDKAVDLRPKDHSVIFDEGFSISGNFSIELYGYDFQQNGCILKIENMDESVSLYWRKTTISSVEYCFIELIDNGVPKYVIYSNKLSNVTSTNYIYIQVQRKKSIYKVKIANKGVSI